MSDLNITPSSTWSAKLPAGAAVFKIIKVNNHFGKATTLGKLTASSCDVNAGRNAQQENFERVSGAAAKSTKFFAFKKCASMG